MPVLRRHARRVGVFIVGWLVILFGLAIGWLPGPGGIPVVLLGLTILATEFAWAERLKRRLMEWATQRLRGAKERLAERRRGKRGYVDEAVEEALATVDAEAALDDSPMDIESFAAPRGRPRKEADEGSIAS